MAYNTPIADNSEVEGIIENALFNLIDNLRKEGVFIEMSDLTWELFSRCESIAIPSEKIFAGEDLPRLFGVYRGYNGGKLYEELTKTEIHKINKRQKAKAERILDLFEKCFWDILKATDKAGEQAQGEPLAEWDKLTI